MKIICPREKSIIKNIFSKARYERNKNKKPLGVVF